MSWAEVKKINSDVSKPLDTLIHETKVSQNRIAMFTSNGTFIVPKGVTNLKISAIAAGGDAMSSTGASGGGGSGRFVLDRVYVVSPSQAIPITVGVGNTIIGSPINLTLTKGSSGYSEGGDGGCGGGGINNINNGGRGFDGGNGQGWTESSKIFGGGGTEFSTFRTIRDYGRSQSYQYGIGGCCTRFGVSSIDNSDIGSFRGYGYGGTGMGPYSSGNEIIRKGGLGIVIIEW